MNSQRCAQLILKGAGGYRNAIVKEVRRGVQLYAHNRSVTMAEAARHNMTALNPGPVSSIVSANTGFESLHVRFINGQSSAIPYHFLRGNCQCFKCTARLETSSSSHSAAPEMVQSSLLGVVVDWSDGHISKYPGDWLYSVAQQFCVDS